MEGILAFFGAFFIFGGFWFYIACLAVFGGLVALADHEENWWAGILVAAFFTGLMYFNSMTIDWSLLPWFLFGYLILGIVMASIKWITYLKVRSMKYADLKEDWVEWYNQTLREDQGQTKVTGISKTTNMKQSLSEEEYSSFVSYIKREDFINRKEEYIIPRWRDKTGKIVSWGMWWPAVIFWSFFNDYIRGAFVMVTRGMRSWYEGLARKIFANVGVSAEDNENLRNRH